MEKKVDNSRRQRAVAGLLSMLVGGALLVTTIPGQAGAQPGGPPGNNGTIKVDREAFDDHPDNEPHVGCIFQVDFYGFDEGDLNAHVSFEVHPPTGKPEEVLSDDVFIGEDDNGGGGSEAGLDASETYDLSSLLQGFEPHPQQGWHVKLTINAEGSQGADTKHKVFWVTGCETPPTTSTTSSTTTTTEKPTTTTESTTTTTEEPTTTTESTTTTTEKPTTTTESTTTTTEESTTSTESTTTTTEAPTTTSTLQPTTTAKVQPAVGTLPETGSDSDGLLIAAGVALLVGGTALLGSTKFARRPRT
jgi:LPXTG-motif cell wall-anchored protein